MCLMMHSLQLVGALRREGHLSWLPLERLGWQARRLEVICPGAHRLGEVVPQKAQRKASEGHSAVDLIPASRFQTALTSVKAKQDRKMQKK